MVFRYLAICLRRTLVNKDQGE